MFDGLRASGTLFFVHAVEGIPLNVTLELPLLTGDAVYAFADRPVGSVYNPAVL